MFGMNPRKVQSLMKSMGISQKDIDAEEVIIKTNDKKIIIKPCSVIKMTMQGQEIFQISGNIQEEESKMEITDKDIQTVIEKTNCSKEKAREFFYRLRNLFIDWNYIEMDSSEFSKKKEEIEKLIEEFSGNEKSL